ncbi:MAG: hypothetical protein LJE90_14720 [Betaproteobacteria bacterium]|jgi:hypothetical protein|nr:hypothetical protein [Betaproteobacteria bacterium]
MNPPLVRMVRINGLQFNANRDPQAYRRPVGAAFRIQALLAGSGEARCTLSAADGRVLAESTERLPGSFRSELQFDTPGSRLVTLAVSSGETQFRQDLRLDVEPVPH